MYFSGQDDAAQAASAAAKAAMEAANKFTSPSAVPGVGKENENALATFLDIAVMRCLFISHWSEDGFFWALMFLNRRYVNLRHFLFILCF